MAKGFAMIDGYAINPKSKIITLQGQLVRWYLKNQHPLPWRETIDAYRIWISEVMLQQTRVETVIPYYRAFITRFPNVSRLAHADLDVILKGWEGLGYYSRARNLHRAAGMIVENFDAKLPRSLEGLRSLPGIGAYIAAAVGSIAFGLPAAVVDGNVKRILARLFTDPTPVNTNGAIRRFHVLADQMLDKSHPGRFNQALMELGQRICTPKEPDCIQCPIRSHCRAHIQGRETDFPVRLPKSKTPLKKMVHVVVQRDNAWLILRRPETGLLGGLWELPGDEVAQPAKSGELVAGLIRNQTGIRIKDISHLGHVGHAYTHFRISSDIYRARFRQGRVALNGHADHAWIRPADIPAYAFHKLTHKIFALLKRY
jgi:A/G-specific adenine glycosylase